MPLQDPSAGTAGTATAVRPLYVYGVTWAAAAREEAAAGIGEADVSPVLSNGLAALTSPLLNPHVRARRRELLAHSEVLAAALERGTVLPLSFGTVFESEEAVVRDFLVPRRDELRRLLRELEGRVELRVKAFYREEAILAEIVRENLRIALGELVAAQLGARSRRDAEAILDRLRPLSLAVDVDEEPIEHQVLRASFLVERKRVRAFDEAMDELARSQDGRIHFKYVGPLPPHSFVSLRPARR